MNKRGAGIIFLIIFMVLIVILVVIGFYFLRESLRSSSLDQNNTLENKTIPLNSYIQNKNNTPTQEIVKKIINPAENVSINETISQNNTPKIVINNLILQYQCSDHLDNDGDGLIDMQDSDCAFSYDDHEGPIPSADDENYLLDVNVSIFNTTTGKENFIVTYQGTYLRINSSLENFYYVPASVEKSLNITYDIVPKKGGVDIVYKIKNINATTSFAPAFYVYGILNQTQNGQFLTGNGQFNDWNASLPGPMRYGDGHWGFSPVIVTKDNNFAVGSSLQYSYIEYGDQIENWAPGHIYAPYSGYSPKVFLPNEERFYTLSLRFSTPRNWIFTLYPYKKYLQSMYSLGTGTIADRDRRPVRTIYSTSGASLISSTNPRGYAVSYGPYPPTHPDTEGFARFTDWLINSTRDRNFQRTMIWGIGGEGHFAYTPQFMAPWTEKMLESQGNFSRVKENNISLGFWWGNTPYIASPIDVWDSGNYTRINISDNKSLEDFLFMVKLAQNRSANEIGLDTYGGIKAADRYWINKNMINIAPNVRMFVEEGYIFPDITLGDKMGTYFEDYVGKITPSPLQWYLTPSSEQWMLIRTNFTTDRIKDLMQSGYTPLVFDSPSTYQTINISSVISPLVPMYACMDGKDNDGDGKKDLYDLDCDNLTDNSE